ncbi:MAG: NAD-dependent epimerase/dehydratase family protein [Candidatus Sericytochromatia bacterium]|nr:NAD-dependent epimerase/dehydratase family protein [Candidatus Sericytochromatia bacterium]
MRILITGGAGFIGSHLVEHHLRAGHQVAVLDDMSGGTRANLTGLLDRVPVFQVDIRDGAAVRATLAAYRPHVVSHHAAQVSVRASADDPLADAETNLIGLLHVLSGCVVQGVRHVVFASSGGTVYGDTPRVPTPEDEPPAPLSPYGISKEAGERYVRCFEASHGLTAAVLRYGNVYGPRQQPHGEAGVVAIFARKLLAGEAPTIQWDGEQRKDFIHVEDVARAHMLAARPGVSGTWNVASGVGTSINALYQAIAGQLGASVRPGRAARRPGDVRASLLAVDRIRQDLGWTPRIDLEVGLIDTLAWCRATHEASLAA